MIINSVLTLIVIMTNIAKFNKLIMLHTWCV